MAMKSDSETDHRKCLIFFRAQLWLASPSLVNIIVYLFMVAIYNSQNIERHKFFRFIARARGPTELSYPQAILRSLNK